ncbi:MAG: spore coat associated protein CotJA [Ruminococcaceae bacterium]|nr:spore coat associated protein CotJA [Oscillospiraceae bacterium]
MVYAPVQRFQGLYEPEEALSRGTIFQELEKPFLGGRGR